MAKKRADGRYEAKIYIGQETGVQSVYVTNIFEKF